MHESSSFIRRRPPEARSREDIGIQSPCCAVVMFYCVARACVWLQLVGEKIRLQTVLISSYLYNYYAHICNPSGCALWRNKAERHLANNLIVCLSKIGAKTRTGNGLYWLREQLKVASKADGYLNISWGDEYVQMLIEFNLFMHARMACTSALGIIYVQTKAKIV